MNIKLRSIAEQLLSDFLALSRGGTVPSREAFDHALMTVHQHDGVHYHAAAMLLGSSAAACGAARRRQQRFEDRPLCVGRPTTSTPRNHVRPPRGAGTTGEARSAMMALWAHDAGRGLGNHRPNQEPTSSVLREAHGRPSRVLKHFSKLAIKPGHAVLGGFPYGGVAGSGAAAGSFGASGACFAGFWWVGRCAHW